MKTALLIITLLLSLAISGQDNIDGRLDYPDSLKLNKEYSFSITNDSILQTIRIKAIGGQELWFSINKWAGSKQNSGGKQSDNYSGIAKWKGAYGVVTEDGIMHLDQWDYTTTDEILTITLYEKSASRLTLTTTDLNLDFMDRTIEE